ncbi:MAG TPA: hypothetical protein VKU36_00640 [Candidatus Babeliales bacterium]|nr:hypothetical protein [Candidatus Babeliales bacterium]
MIKKICFLTTLALSTASILAMSVTDAATMTTQLNHINTQMNAIKRAWNVERIHIKKAEKASSTAYTQIRPILERIIASDGFIAQMNEKVASQFESIINSNASFQTVKTDNNIADLFPNLKMNQYGMQLYKAMANKAYLFALGQKLAEKAREIGESIRKSQLDDAKQSIA